MKGAKFYKLNSVLAITVSLLLISVILLSTYVMDRNQKGIQALAQERILDAKVIVIDRISKYFDPVRLYDRLFRMQWDPSVDFENMALALENEGRQLVRLYPHITSMQYGDKWGNFVMFRKDEKGNINTKIVISDEVKIKEKAQPRIIWRYFEGDDLKSIVRIKGNDYDPRTRPWYIEAKDISGMCMTEPYAFYTGSELGITAAHRLVYKGVVVGVFGYDIALSDLVTYMNSLKLSADGETFLVTPKKQVIGIIDKPINNDPITGFLSSLPAEYDQIIEAGQLGQVLNQKTKGLNNFVVFERVLHEFENSWYVGIRMYPSDLIATQLLNLRLMQLLSLLLITEVYRKDNLKMKQVAKIAY